MSERKPVSSEPARIVEPVRTKERIEFVDILRGFAVLGILVMNMTGFSGHSLTPQAFTDPIDKVVVILIIFLTTAKFYSLFSFLFGWGMAMQMTRASAKGMKFLPRYIRRLFILLIIGILHGVLIWNGDILTLYAMLGFVLLLFRKRSGKTLLLFVALCLILSIILTVPGDGLDAFREWYTQVTDFLRSDNYPDSLYTSGTYTELNRLRLEKFLGAFSSIIYYFGNVFGMFLLGLYVGKRNIFRDIQKNLSLLRKVMWLGLGIGVTFNTIFVANILLPGLVPDGYSQLVKVGARTIGAPALMLFYVSGIILLVQNKTWHWRLQPLANVGRMALTNYILQSVVATLLFYGYGLGLYGEASPGAALIMTVLLYLAQIRFSEWWFDKYQFGPLEWVWRTLTYGKRQPIRRGETYENLKPLAWVEKARTITAKINPTVALVGVWLVLLVWAGGLYAWYVRLETKHLDVPFEIVLEVTATPVQIADAEEILESQDQGSVEFSLPSVRPVPYQPGRIAASGDVQALAAVFDPSKALSQIEALTGLTHGGRLAGSPQGWAAGDYIAGQFAQYRLQPAGEDGTFFQSFPVEYNPLADMPSLVVEGPDGVTDRYELYLDYSPVVRWYNGPGASSGEVTWVNNCSQDDFFNLDVVGKVALCHYTPPLLESGRNALEHGAVGLLLLTTPDRRTMDFASPHHDTWVPEPIPTFWVSPSVVEDLLKGSSLSIEDLFTTFEPFSLKTSVQMELSTLGQGNCPNAMCLGRNVLGVLPGRDPAYANEVIILGAHYDHMGQGPDGTVWMGANDDASGVAVLLEIARSWKVQGYVPRHTVLFAAWDAEELGLLGSRHYVEHPSYPLTSTVAMIQLDMVGEGGDVFQIGGKRRLSERLLAATSGLGVEAEIIQMGGRSDHAPFLEENVPASMITWSDEEGPLNWHMPTDTPENIELDKLEVVGEVTGIALLDIFESEPSIRELLVKRAAAIEQGQLEIFLSTSNPEQRAADRFWFMNLQEFSPRQVEIKAADLQVSGSTATAEVRFDIKYQDDPEQADQKTMKAALAAQFKRSQEGWKWAGPELVWVKPDEILTGESDLENSAAFSVAYPPRRERGMAGLGQIAAAQYAEIAGLLGLPTWTEADLLLLPDTKALRVSVAMSLSTDHEVWVKPGEVKLVYSEHISTSQQLTDALAQLVLADAGLTEAVAPWLWNGLPLVLQAYNDLVATQPKYLPGLHEAINKEEPIPDSAAAWAALDYLRRRVGWNGLGEFIADLGYGCQIGNCENRAALDQALNSAVESDAASFESLWMGYWRTQLESVQANLDAVLQKRVEAVLNGDEAIFITTVDPDVPNLVEVERDWFADLGIHPAGDFSLIARPLAVMENGDVYAEATTQYHFTEIAGDPGEKSVSLRILFTAGDSGYRWAGFPFETLHGRLMDVRYPRGDEDMARAVLSEAEVMVEELAGILNIDELETLTIELYETQDSFRSSISLSYPVVEWVPAWSGRGKVIKLRLGGNISSASNSSALATHLARSLLHQTGVNAEWLLKGVSGFIFNPTGGGVSQIASVTDMNDLLQVVRGGGQFELANMPLDHELSSGAYRIARTQAWDTVRYLVDTFGWDALMELLQYHTGGMSLEEAVQASLNQTLADFEQGWSDSLSRGHVLPAWEEIVQSFNPQIAMGHIEFLIGPELKGRRAGTPGDGSAAEYIAGKFVDYGLVPAGDGLAILPGEGAGSNIITDDPPSFFQNFPISLTISRATPRIDVLNENERIIYTFNLREDFLTTRPLSDTNRTAMGELVWMPEMSNQKIDLAGKIVVHIPSSSIENDISWAVEHEASGLILLGFERDEGVIFAKQLGANEEILASDIPVFAFTRAGRDRFLEVFGETRESIMDKEPGHSLGVTVRMDYPQQTPVAVETANVLGLIPGSDPFLSRELIILGAHYDHVGDDPDVLVCPETTNLQQQNAECEWAAGRRYTGANDDASGIAVLLEIARMWQEAGYHPRRSVLFAAWGAQELGQIGSSFYVSNPTLPLENVVAMIQMDGVAGGDGFFPDAKGNWEQDGLLLFNLQVAQEKAGEKIIITDGVGLSDNVPFHNAGLPSVLVSWRLANEDNLPVGLADGVNPVRLTASGRMVALAVMNIAR